MLVSCDKKAGFELPLGLDQENAILSSSIGETPIMVYSSTTWTAGFRTPVTWAALDRLGGSGSGEVKFSYSENYGSTRSVEVVFSAGDVEKSIVMTQLSKEDEENGNE